MKIGIDCRLWKQTGVGRYIRNLVWELQEIDHTNEYVLFCLPNDAKVLNTSLAKSQNTLKWKVVVTDIHWHSLAEQITFPQILYKEKLDLMHFPYFSLPILYNRPFVVTIHDLIITHFPTGKASTLPLPLYYLKRFAYEYIVKQALKKAKKIIVPLHAVEKDLKQTFRVRSDHIAVTYEGVDESIKNTLAFPSNAFPYFLYVGNAYPHKNIERLIESFLQFRKEEKKDIALVLVGKNDYFYKRIEKEILGKKHEGIIFKHDITDTELFSLYKNARVFVSPSLMEGFGLPALEAMSVSCPVLVSDIPSFKEVCQDAAFYFDPYSISDMKKKMQFVYNLDSKKLQVYKDRGIIRVKDFSWKEMAKQTQKVYESSIGVRQSK
ncbi:MAG: glycosyltransferase family 1 protein [Patescibacteria group bacterium]